MAKTQTGAPAGWRAEAISGAARALLLVPEAPLIAALLCVYWAFGEPPLLGVAVALMIVAFIARWLALAGARLALEAAHFRQADALAQIALALYPWSADALALRGATALASGRAEEAESALRRANLLLPGQPNLHAALSGALLAQGRSVEAAASARQALMLAPAHAIAHLYLAEAEQAAGAPPEAVEERLRAGLAAAALPEAEAAIRCALGAHLLAERRIAEATLTLHGAEALLPRCRPARQIELRVRIAELLIAQGQIERAREQFRNVAEMDPNGRFSGAAWRASHMS
jgi:tetratricopeptide (TPR) repeat protein